ncbi:sigma-54-dependent Fis family transcriptional regulator [Paenibacillus sp. DMB20]|uniref:sigma-54-dependent Fis family transcriptional regulator n=1 Tax=Paenibacillus sp. DMB20 TaxID=1642570 RepID=UPI0006279F48|nr:sigma-54-dependent Fis family transcriptional regulator [Paenibacillus sp. DMB20]KKO55168.1 transcriptional regulator [Paenibacillus sp. DMB20]
MGKSEIMEAVLGGLLGAMNDAVTVIDSEGAVMYWNRVAEETYGITGDDIIGRKIGDFFQRESIMLFQVMESGRAVHQVYHEPRPGVHVMINAAPVTDASGKPIGALSIERDISSYVRLSAEMYHHPEGQPLLPAVFPSALREPLRTVFSLGQPLLLAGEAGVGRTSIAEWLHRSSGRTGRFVMVSCSTVPEGMLEAELFGYQGVEERAGKLDLAAEGTLYLKDIDALAPSMQERLAGMLRVSRYERLGGTASVPLQCRVCGSVGPAADLKERLLPSLRYAFQLYEVPPLRDRKQDLPELCRLFLHRAASQAGLTGPELMPDAMAAVSACDWPGNLTQLRNAMEYAVAAAAAAGTGAVTSAQLPEYARLTTLNELTDPDLPLSVHSGEWERARIAEMLERAGGNKAKAARMLGISRGALYYKMRQYGLE